MNASLNTEQRPTGNCIEFPIPSSFHTAISFSGGEEYLMTSHRGRETKFLDTRHWGIQFAFTSHSREDVLCFKSSSSN